MYAWSVLFDVKQENPFRGASEKAIGVIYILLHPAILLCLLIFLTLLSLSLAYFWMSEKWFTLASNHGVVLTFVYLTLLLIRFSDFFLTLTFLALLTSQN